MSIDLDPAIEAAARDWFDRQQAQRMDPGRHHDDGAPWQWEDLPSTDQRAFLAIARPVVTAAAPLVEAQMRESIAEEIEANWAKIDDFYDGSVFAARLARGAE